MQIHAALGYNMLKNSNKPILQAAAIVAGEHHEKWDGSCKHFDPTLVELFLQNLEKFLPTKDEFRDV